MLGPTREGQPAQYVDVPITAPAGVDVPMVINAKIFKEWMYSIDADPMLTVKGVRPVLVQRRELCCCSQSFR